jgi:O-6-methylguanine DNA methyltransferase
MQRAEDRLADAVIRVGGMAFQVWLSDKGVTRIILPKLSGSAPGSRGQGQKIRIDTREGVDSESKAMLEKLAVFLCDLVEGTAPEVSPPADLEGLSSFAREVLGVVANIPRGQSRSYGWIAERVEKPGAARAVGGAVGRNPVPLLVPCHRVVGSDGSIGGWSGAPGWKEYLLEQEAE